MFQGEEIQKLVELLKERDAYLYHACQLLDFKSYLNLGGIPSRSHLETKRQPYTPFKTDQRDRTNGVWDKVFANLSDFGSTFATGGPTVPNTYGPILFQIRPEALLDATDVAICLRSAGGQGFKRESEAFTSVQDVDRLFQYPIGNSKSHYVKSRKQLQEEFTPQASAPEISCTLESGLFSLQYVKLVRVEPYLIGGEALQVKVENLKSNTGGRFQVFERELDRCPTYTNELVNILESGVPSLYNLSDNSNVSQELRAWAKRVIDQEIAYQFNERFAPYLYHGTILPILKGQL
jgi:hypothetical protein